MLFRNCVVLLLFFCAEGRLFVPGLEEHFHDRDEQEADQRRGEAAVIEQEAAVRERHACDQRVMQHAEHDPGPPAVFARDGERPLAKQSPMTMACALMAVVKSVPRAAQRPFVANDAAT